jgi:hypothetical protein
MFARARRIVVTALLLAAAVGGVTWSVLALWFDGPASRLLAGIMAACIPLAALLLVALVRPLRLALAACFLPVVAVAVWWISIPPSNQRDWSPEVARLASATFDGNRLTIENVRNFQYRSETDYNPHWETRTFDLDKIQGVDLFISFWGPTLIAHTFASWQFADGQHLAISIETRKEKGESYSAVRGFFRQYELYYVVADERDLVGLRTDYRGEQVYLYRLRASPATARALLLDYLKDVNQLRDHPSWYNALTHNCTTTIRYHAKNVAAGRPFDWRILANGYLDELAYQRGQIDTGLPFTELRARSNITEKAKAADDSPDFSALIRVGLPGSHDSRS